MTAPSPSLAQPVTPAMQVRLSFLLLTIIVGTFLGLDWLACNQRLAGYIQNWDLRRFENEVELFMNRANFIDFEDRLILDELPKADYSKGGAYFFGTSALKWALKTWELPPEQRRFVGNYGIGATSHELQFQFIRYLVEEEGLLQAGGDKVQVVLGAYFSMGMDWSPDGFFGRLWPRHGLYSYDPSTGIRPVGMGTVPLTIARSKARCSGFVSAGCNRLARFITTAIGGRLASTEKIRDPDRIRKYAQSMAGGRNWQDPLARQMASLGETIDYLKARQANVAVVLLPTRNAYFEFELPSAYREQVKTLSVRAGVGCLDLSNLLKEDEFWDINHSNARGLDKTHKAMMDLVRPHLRAHGLLP